MSCHSSVGYGSRYFKYGRQTRSCPEAITDAVRVRGRSRSSQDELDVQKGECVCRWTAVEVGMWCCDGRIG